MIHKDASCKKLTKKTLLLAFDFSPLFILIINDMFRSVELADFGFGYRCLVDAVALEQLNSHFGKHGAKRCKLVVISTGYIMHSLQSWISDKPLN